MGINGVSNNLSTYGSYTSSSAALGSTQESTNSKKQESGVVYESTSKSISEMSEEERSALVLRLKSDQEARTNQMVDLVRQMMSKQGSVYGQTDDVWKFLASGNYTVDAQTKAQALENISEDGYWGVKQTSERIYSFAQALSGGDEEQMEKMKQAFIRGFKDAAKSWGKELPQISRDTYDAVMAKFENKEPAVK